MHARDMYATLVNSLSWLDMQTHVHIIESLKLEGSHVGDYMGRTVMRKHFFGKTVSQALFSCCLMLLLSRK